MKKKNPQEMIPGSAKDPVKAWCVFLCKNTDWLGTSTYSPIGVYTQVCIWYTVISQWKMLWDQLNTSSHHGYLQCRCGRMNAGPKQCHWHMLGGCLAWQQVCRELEHQELPPAEIQEKEPITSECGRKNRQTNNTIIHTNFKHNLDFGFEDY